jgi:hypothetical protein
MNSTILAERQAKAIQAIQTETSRLGGEYIPPTQRVDSPATKYTLILEAVANALAGIELTPPEPPVVADEPDAPKAKTTASKRSSK